MKRKLIPILGSLLFIGVLIGVLSLVPPKNTIVLKNDGFHPRILTVQAGETVTFVNARDKYFWPASDFHPKHTLYPSFDALEPLAPDVSYSFTFTEPGVYPFHDHLAAFYFGIVQVADENGVVVDDCMQRGGTFQCWQNQIFITLAQGGVDAAYDEVAKLFASDPAFHDSCHSIAHNIGLASYQFYEQDPDFILSPKATACAAGFYHGFMEGYIGATGDVVGAGKVCEDIGAGIGKEAPDARLQCYHGIGHGAVESTVAQTGVFGTQDAFVREALSLCETAAPGVEERYRCASGVYNGLANFYIIGAYGLSSEKEDPLELCARQEEVYKEACYGNMNSIVYHSTQGTFLEAAGDILAISDVNERPRALEYLLLLFASHHIKDTTFAPIINDCRTLPPMYVQNCLNGFTRGLLEHGAPGEEYKQALVLCREPALTQTERDTCYDIVVTRSGGWYGKETIAKICAYVRPEERVYCPS